MDTAASAICPAPTGGSGATTHPAPMRLPPLEDALVVVHRYFTHFNPLIPLFSQPEFMCMLHKWYSSPASRERAEWACINIVLALGSWIPALPVHEIDFSRDEAGFARYMTNAQSVLAELVTREQDLLGLQVLLGLVLLFETTNDARPAAVLIGAAIRLAHRLRLQSGRDVRMRYPPEEELTRSRLFWIAYMLDKEISLRHRTPSVQLDADIDLDLPSGAPEDGVGDIYSLDGRVRINYLRLRVRLAHIQGRVYDLLYSTRSAKASEQQRQHWVLRLSHQLESWRLAIPAEMQLGSVVGSMGRVELFLMSSLHCAYLSSMVMVHGIWSSRAGWIKRLSNYSIELIQQSRMGCDTHGCLGGQNPPLPSAWAYCVQVSRECLAMASMIPQSDCNIW